MAISCHIIPDFVSGDDSLVDFNLRFKISEPYALPGSFCDCGFSCLSSTALVDSNYSYSGIQTGENNISAFSAGIWSFFLTPLTRWDSARFLRLAHRPAIRDAKVSYLQHRALQTKESTCYSIDHEKLVKDAEESHPFLPLFPFLIQCVAVILGWLLPRQLLPPTCEGVLVLSSWVLNTICFILASSNLYKMTKALLAVADESDLLGEKWARRVTLLFIFNPANVFFGVAYSEALGAALVFAGCRLMIEFQLHRRDSFHPAYFFASVFTWWLACWTRSNGTLYGGFLILYGIGRGLTLNKRIFTRLITLAIMFAFGFILYFGSVGLHNRLAVQRSCVDDAVHLVEKKGCRTSAYRNPSWCKFGPTFNLYSYVQRKYWNVGFLRYYQLKQMPNFLLAAPVIIFSIVAVATWIWYSWTRFSAEENVNNDSSIKASLFRFFRWSAHSLCAFGYPEDEIRTAYRIEFPDDVLVGNSVLLGHYAVLAASTMLVLTIAHVQIATRMILSTCPALYWFLAVKVSHGGWLGNSIMMWCILYIILGVIMHPNWLPWT